MAIRPELREALRSLPARDRRELADDLYDSLAEDPGDPDWEAAWSEEIARRVQEIVDGCVTLDEADDVHEELRKDLRNAAR